MAIDINTVESYLNNIRSTLDQFQNYLVNASGQDPATEGSPAYERRINHLASVKLRSFLDVLDQMEAADTETIDAGGPLGDGRTAVEMFDAHEAEHIDINPQDVGNMAEAIPETTVPMNGIFPIDPNGDYHFSPDPEEARAIANQVQREELAERSANRNIARMHRYDEHAEQLEDLVKTNP